MALATDASIMTVDPQALKDIAAAVSASDLARASEIANAALAKGMRHPVLFNARALLAQQQNRHQDALNDFEQALNFMPRNFALLNAVGLSLVKLNRASEAIAFFDSAISIAPAIAQTYYRKGWAYEAMADQKEAKRWYERAISLQPNYPEALAGLAIIAARSGDPKRARDFGERALRSDRGEPTAAVALAMADIAEKSYSSAEARLLSALQSPRAVDHARAVMLGFLGDALDGQNRIADAFEAYSQENSEYYRMHAPRFANQRDVVEMIDELSNYFETAPKWTASEEPLPTAAAPRRHVFLMGFLRSGTTLLEQILTTHRDVLTLEERETFADIAPAFFSSREGLDRLAALSGVDLTLARDAYWNRVREYGADPGGKVFIDKQPLNAFNLPLIAKLFPKALVIFALRDPRDVIFSCFRRHFEINATTFKLLQLDEAAHYYASVMRLAELCNEKLPLHMYRHRYENLIGDFDRSVQAVCEFIGVEWGEEMRDFTTLARRATIRSPSASQVRRQLYGEGVEQWRRYAAYLKPAMPPLQPWIEKFGYPSE